MRLIDLSHPIRPGMNTYPGLPVPEVRVLMDYEDSRTRYENQAEFHIASIHLCGNTGTYVDAPIHRYPGGTDLADLPLDCVAELPVVVVRCERERAVGPAAFRPLPVQGCAVLVQTGWSRYWGTAEYFNPNPHLTAAACDHLVAAGAYFVGIDSVNIDDMADLSRPAHTKLLGAGIPICEHLTNLQSVPQDGARLHAVPIPWVGGASFPVRAYVVCPD